VGGGRLKELELLKQAQVGKKGAIQKAHAGLSTYTRAVEKEPCARSVLTTTQPTVTGSNVQAGRAGG
jgi:hypothetical protein